MFSILFIMGFYLIIIKKKFTTSMTNHVLQCAHVCVFLAFNKSEPAVQIPAVMEVVSDSEVLAEVAKNLAKRGACSFHSCQTELNENDCRFARLVFRENRAKFFRHKSWHC